MLGEEGQGFKIAMKVLDNRGPGSPRRRSGSRKARSTTRPSTPRGESVRQADLAEQGLQFMMADMKTEVEAARLLLYEAARKCDENAADVTTWARWPSSSAATSR